jgi:tRNA uridine 5-carboxymethylaminomethyl modification enzyme
MVREIEQQEHLVIPDSINYDNIHSLSTEGRNKLKKVKPETIGQATRISGVNPSDIAVLMVYLKT